jgi:hypothetical protein
MRLPSVWLLAVLLLRVRLLRRRGRRRGLGSGPRPRRLRLVVLSDAFEDRIEHLYRHLRIQRAVEEGVELGGTQGVDVLHIHAPPNVTDRT